MKEKSIFRFFTVKKGKKQIKKINKFVIFRSTIGCVLWGEDAILKLIEKKGFNYWGLDYKRRNNKEKGKIPVKASF